MKVQVTEADIAIGRGFGSKACPVAQALYRLGFDYVDVNAFRICVEQRVYDTPRVAAEFILEHDSDYSAPLEPFEFTLGD